MVAIFQKVMAMSVVPITEEAGAKTSASMFTALKKRYAPKPNFAITLQKETRCPANSSAKTATVLSKRTTTNKKTISCATTPQKRRRVASKKSPPEQPFADQEKLLQDLKNDNPTSFETECHKIFSKDVYIKTYYSFLMKAAVEEKRAVFTCLLKGAKFPLACADLEGNTPLHYIATHGWHELVEVIGHKNPIISTNFMGATALETAICNRNFVTARRIFDIWGPALLAANDIKGSNTLMRSACAGALDACEWLLDAGFPLEAENLQGCTPLFYAVDSGQKDVVGLLLKRGADYTHRNKFGHSPLSFAAKNGYKSIALLLLLHDENVAEQTGGDLKIQPDELRWSVLRLLDASKTTYNPRHREILYILVKLAPSLLGEELRSILPKALLAKDVEIFKFMLELYCSQYILNPMYKEFLIGLASKNDKHEAMQYLILYEQDL